MRTCRKSRVLFAFLTLWFFSDRWHVQERARLFTWCHPVHCSWCRPHIPAGVGRCWASRGRMPRGGHSNRRSLCDSPRTLCSPDSTAPPPKKSQHRGRAGFSARDYVCGCVSNDDPSNTRPNAQVRRIRKLSFPLHGSCGRKIKERRNWVCPYAGQTDAHTNAP